jgi:sec-independent protein translocase protein TatA
MDVGPGELLLIIAMIGLLFGAKKLPELARSLGKAKAEFRRGLGESEPESPGGQSAES